MMPDNLLSHSQMQAMEFLERCLRDLEPLVALTGGAGSGKTVTLNTLLARPGMSARQVIRVNNFVAGPLSLHRVLASSLGVVDAGDLSAEALEPALRRALVESSRSEPPVLAVDDAQSLLPETLRYLCLLAGLREAGRPLLRIVLAGRPGFAIRQSMPRQFTLEAPTPDDARRLVLHGFGSAGVAAPDEAVESIVRNAQGNLRKLDVLLAAGIETARVESRRRMTARRGQVRAEVQNARPVRGSAGSSWLVFPALLVVGAAGLALAYQGGMFGGQDGRPVAAAVTSPPPPAMAGARAGTTPDAPVNSPSVPAPPTVAVAPPAATAPLAAATPAPPPAEVQIPAQPAQAATVQPPQAAPSPSQTEPSQAAPSQAAPSQAAPAQADADVPSTHMSLPVGLPPATGQSGTHFRVYNISSCHHSVCPRWSVTDLDQQQHFVAAFNPGTLHLDQGMLRKLREGSIDLVVSGSIVQNGPDGRTLNADAMQEVVPHHGRSHAQPLSVSPPPSDLQPPPGAQAPSGSQPIQLAPPQIQSPPPGFLPVPPPAQ